MTSTLTREQASWKVVLLADELCVALDNGAEDIGGSRPVDTILKELGPAVDMALSSAGGTREERALLTRYFNAYPFGNLGDAYRAMFPSTAPVPEENLAKMGHAYAIEIEARQSAEAALRDADGLLREALREWEIWMETGEVVMGAETTAHKHRTRIAEIRRHLDSRTGKEHG